nr:hypothetical protein [Tanacetum cinerariifolium]
MQGTSLTKQEMECKLCDEFDKFAYKKGESLHYGLVVLVFQKGDDPIDAINHMMLFLTAVVTFRYPPTNNQLRQNYLAAGTSRVIEQPIQRRQNSLASGTSRPYTSGPSGNNSGKQRTVVCYNCKGEGHMSKQCKKPMRKKDKAWFKDKIALMANLSYYDSDNLAEVHNPNNVTNNVINQVVQAMPISEQSNIMNQSETKITSDSNIIPYSQYVSESQYVAVQNSNIPIQQDALILSVIEQLKIQVVNCTKINQDNKSVNETLTAELERYKDQELNLSTRPTQVEVPKELPKVSMVNSSLKKLKFHLASFDVVVKERTTSTANSDKLMVVTPVNKTKKIIFTEPITSSGNTPIKTASSSNVVSNKPMLSSTGVNLPNSASGSQPSGNTKKDRIQQTQSSTKKNKLEGYPMNVRTSLHNKKSVVNTKYIASVLNSKLNVNSDLQCVTFNVNMTSLADKAILSGADNRPPMLKKDMHDSWKSRMELYMLNRQHGRMILELVEHSPLLWPTVEEDGVIRLKKYSELSAAEAIQADCDYVSQAPSSSNLSISYPPNDIPSTINHNAYMASSLIPQIDYAPTVPQHSEVTIQPIQGRQNSMSAGSSRPFASGSGGASGKQRVIVCYNCKGEGHMSKQCTKPKRKRDAEWFKDK